MPMGISWRPGLGCRVENGQYQADFVVVNCMEELLRVLISFHFILFIYLFEKQKSKEQNH